METKWMVRRQSVVRSNGQRHWDRAYQHLLRWASQQDQQEVDDASGPVRTGLDAAPDAVSTPVRFDPAIANLA